MSNPSPEAGAPPVCYRHPGREAHIRCQRCGRPICPDCMNDASVGFQCPSCVSEGAKSTRSGRTAYGGVRSRNPQTTTIALIGINVFVWVLILATGYNDSRVADYLALRLNGLCLVGNGGFELGSGACAAEGGTFLPGVVDGAYWQLVTSMFAHVSPLHIAFNMYALWYLGPQLEASLGRVRFLALYFVSGLAGSTLVYWASSEYASTLGASGAVFGMLGALLVIVLKVGGNVQPLLILLAINAVLTFTVGNISWQGHLGGFLGGVAVGGLLAYAPRSRRSTVQALGMTGIVVLLAVAVVARSLSLA